MLSDELLGVRVRKRGQTRVASEGRRGAGDERVDESSDRSPMSQGLTERADMKVRHCTQFGGRCLKCQLGVPPFIKWRRPSDNPTHRKVEQLAGGREK